MTNLTLKVGEKESDSIFLASFPLEPRDMSALDFDVYSSSQDSVFKKRKILVAETARIEYVGENDDESNCKYVIGIVNRDTGIVELKEATKVIMSHTVKELKPEESRLIGEKNYLARNSLGQIFGTKKRKKLINAIEINQVRVESMASVAPKIKELIAKNSVNIPLKEEVEIQTMADRLIPPCNHLAIEPLMVYDIESIIPTSVLKSMDVSDLWDARLVSDCDKLLKYLDLGTFLRSKIAIALKEKRDKLYFKKLIYLAILFKTFSLSQRALRKDNFARVYLGNPSALVVNLIETHFLEQLEEDGEVKLNRTDKLKDKLLIWSLCLALLLNNLTVDLIQIGGDLKVSMQVITRAAKELGCRVDTKRADGTVQRTASLLLPLSFPKKTRAPSQ